MDISYKKYIESFGGKIFFLKAIRKFFYKRNTKIAKLISNFNEKTIKDFLLRNVIQSQNDMLIETDFFKNNNIKKNSTIWIMWWQGYNSKTPNLVKKCIDRVKKLNPKHKIVIITQYNINNYIHLDDDIVTNFKMGNISITHLSDIIRVNLLYLYGGIWIDSTVFCTKKIPEYIYSREFYTIKTGVYTNEPSHGRWTTFFMESSQGSTLMKFLVECFNNYFKSYHFFIDYIMFDYLIDIGCDIDSSIAKLIDNVPINNTDVFELRANLLKPVGSFELEKKETYLYKLSYKDKFTYENTNSEYNIYTMLFGKEKE